MKQYVYKCVPGPRTVNIGKKGSHGEAVLPYQNIINDQAKDGWELVLIDELSSFQPPGCLSGLFGSKGEVATIKMLVFRKEVS